MDKRIGPGQESVWDYPRPPRLSETPPPTTGEGRQGAQIHVKRR